MNLQEIAYQYIQACKLQEAQEDQVHKALAAICPDNMVMGLADTIHKPYKTLIRYLVGEQVWDWMEWWQYEADYGSKPLHFSIDGKKYDPTTMTFYKFWELIYS